MGLKKRSQLIVVKLFSLALLPNYYCSCVVLVVHSLLGLGGGGWHVLNMWVCVGGYHIVLSFYILVSILYNYFSSFVCAYDMYVLSTSNQRVYV